MYIRSRIHVRRTAAWREGHGPDDRTIARARARYGYRVYAQEQAARVLTAEGRGPLAKRSAGDFTHSAVGEEIARALEGIAQRCLLVYLGRTLTGDVVLSQD